MNVLSYLLVTGDFLGIWYAHQWLSLLVHSVFYHRYGTHKQFAMSKSWEHFFYFFTWFLLGPSFLNPKAYAQMHELHHLYSDTENDPHSPKYALNMFTMMWKTRNIYNEIKEGSYALVCLCKNKTFPEWKHWEAFFNSGIVAIAFIAVHFLLYFYFAPFWWCWFFFPLTLLSGPFHGALVNWFGHKLGYRNYEREDDSRNTTLLAHLMHGETFQNNHHEDEFCPNFARNNKKWEFDTAYFFLLLLQKIHVIEFSQKALRSLAYLRKSKLPT